MLRLITSVFAISLALQAQAGTPPALEDLSEIVDACDRVIDKQGQLIIIQKNRIDELQTDNDKLSQTIIELNRESEKKTSPVVYGAVGIAVGVALTVLVRGIK